MGSNPFTNLDGCQVSVTYFGGDGSSKLVLVQELSR